MNLATGDSVVALARNAESLVEDDGEELAGDDDEPGISADDISVDVDDISAEAGDLDEVEPGDAVDEADGNG
jgi:hypothetical protein